MRRSCPRDAGIRGYRCACEPAAAGRPPVRTTPRRSTSRLHRRTASTVHPVAGRRRPACRLVGATTRDTPPGFGRPSFGGGVPQYGPTTAHACAAQEESARGSCCWWSSSWGWQPSAELAISGLSTGSGSSHRLSPTRMRTTRSRLLIAIRRLSQYPETYEQAEQWITNTRLYNQMVAGAGAL